MKISGERLKGCRDRLALSQQQLADAAGVSVRAVVSWEKSENGINPQAMRRLAEVLDTRPEYLAGDEPMGKVEPRYPEVKDEGVRFSDEAMTAAKHLDLIAETNPALRQALAATIAAAASGGGGQAPKPPAKKGPPGVSSKPRSVAENVVAALVSKVTGSERQ